MLDEPELRRALGDAPARRIRARLADLRAAATLAEVAALPGVQEEPTGRRFAFHLGENARLVVAISDDPALEQAAPRSRQTRMAVEVLEVREIRVPS